MIADISDPDRDAGRLDNDEDGRLANDDDSDAGRLDNDDDGRLANDDDGRFDDDDDGRFDDDDFDPPLADVRRGDARSASRLGAVPECGASTRRRSLLWAAMFLVAGDIGGRPPPAGDLGGRPPPAGDVLAGRSSSGCPADLAWEERLGVLGNVESTANARFC